MTEKRNNNRVQLSTKIEFKKNDPKAFLESLKARKEEAKKLIDSKGKFYFPRN